MGEVRLKNNNNDKLKIDSRLPKIILPKNKLKMFADWWNEDIRFEKTIPHSFEEGYLIIENEHGCDVSKFNILIKTVAKQYKTTYRNIEIEMTKFLNVLRKLTLYFKFLDENHVYVSLYGNDDSMISNINFKVNENQSHIEDKIVLYDYDNLDNVFANCKDIDNVLNIFNMQFIYYLATCLWYIATTATNTKYIYEEKHPIITNRKKGVVQVSDTKYIRTPVYDMRKIKTVKVDKLISRKKGWTYSHSFQVHGHYRHYKDGKTIFIESYIKGRDKPFKSQTTILAPEKIKED